MTRALLYLWFALLKRRAWQFVRELRRPTSLIGFMAVLVLFIALFYWRREEFFARLLDARNVGVLAFLLLAGSLFKGFCQRGLVFEPPDIEFLFTSPFTQRQIVCYRLLPSYLYSVVQAIVVAALFAPHLAHPLFAAACLALFQITCFHAATGAAIFAGTLSEPVHNRLRCMAIGALTLLGLLYFRLMWDIRFIPAFMLAPPNQWFFYPAITLPDVQTAPFLYRVHLQLWPLGSHLGNVAWVQLSALAGLAVLAGVSLLGVFKLKAQLFEASLAPTSRAAERRLRVRQGRDITETAKSAARTARLPALPVFRGFGAIIWKNLLVARRSRRQMTTAVIFTCIFTLCLGAIIHQVYSEMPAEVTPRAVEASRGFNLGVALALAMLAFFLQRMFPFDFRRDGRHLLGLRNLPVPPVMLVLAEVAVPVGCVLVCQFVGLLPLLVFGRFEWPLLLMVLLAYPAVALALTLVWNLHYLLSGARHAGGRDQSASPVGILLVVALSFLVFFPAIETISELSDKLNPMMPGLHTHTETAGFWGRSLQGGFALSLGSGLLVQYLINGLLLLLLAWMFQRLEVAREA